MAGVFYAKGSGVMACYNTVMKDLECAKDYLSYVELGDKNCGCQKAVEFALGTMTFPTSITSQPKELLALSFDLPLRHPQGRFVHQRRI